jgi:diadenosine tetraphosphate (Ap4A) HIT family hydrolase
MGRTAVPYPIDDQPGGCPVCEHLADRDGGWPVVTASPCSVVFVPSRQASAGTTLVVPCRHVSYPCDLPEPEAADLWLLMREMVGATMRGFGPPSYHVSQYAGPITGEPLRHLLWRIEPRYEVPPEVYVPVMSLPRVDVAERRRQAGLLRRHLTSSPVQKGRGGGAGEGRPE